MKNKKGFTLIEMLVVVAIVGILSAVVLTALGPSRAKARDARIISGVNQIRILEEIYFTNNGKYYDSAEGSAPAGWSDIVTDIGNQGGSLLVDATGDMANPAYAAFSKLASNQSSLWYCVDSKGIAKTLTTSVPGSAVDVCP